VRTYTRNARILENPPEFGPRVFGQACEAGIGITYRRTQLNGLKSSLGKVLNRAGKVFGDHGSDRPGLTSDWQA
jgi:hypothetical protein